MYRIQAESRQKGFEQNLQQERQMLSVEADLHSGADALKTQLLAYSTDLDQLLLASEWDEAARGRTTMRK